MNATTEIERKYTRLSFEDGQVLVDPKDENRFFLSAEKAIEACKQAVRTDARIQGYKSEFLTPLHEWCLEHASHVRACYITVSANCLQVFVVTHDKKFDFDFAKKVSALELKFAEKWEISIMQLPNSEAESLAAFINKSSAWEIYADGGSTPE